MSIDSEHPALQSAPRRPLHKTQSWSPDMSREEVWRRRKGNNAARRSRAIQSLTEEDLDELKGCIDLGFGFEANSPELDPKLSSTIPALGFYCSVNKQYNDCLSRSSSSSSSMVSEGISGSSPATSSIIEPGGSPEVVKTRLKQWAQAVACSVKQFSGERSNR